MKSDEKKALKNKKEWTGFNSTWPDISSESLCLYLSSVQGFKKDGERQRWNNLKQYNWVENVFLIKGQASVDIMV